MARNEQLIRQHKILQILERYRFGRTLDEIRDDLVDELGLTSLHQRTVRRDLEALQAAGIDVDVHESLRGKIWKFGPMVKGTHKITASATELIALSLSRDLLYPLAGTPFWLGIESFWSKMREQLPEAVWSHYEKYRQTLFVRGMPAKSYRQQHGILQTLHRCIQEHRVAEIEYQPIGKDATQRQIEPYAVVFYQSSLYIIAAAARSRPASRGRIRHWKLDRFLKATALDQWFQRPADFDLEQHLGQSSGDLRGRRQRQELPHPHQRPGGPLGAGRSLASGPASRARSGRQHGPDGQGGPRPGDHPPRAQPGQRGRSPGPRVLPPHHRPDDPQHGGALPRTSTAEPSGRCRPNVN